MCPQGACFPQRHEAPVRNARRASGPGGPGERSPRSPSPRPAEPYPRVEDIKLKDRRYASRELRRSSSQSFAVRIERDADVPLVVHGFNRRDTEQLNLLVERLDALRQRDTTESSVRR